MATKVKHLMSENVICVESFFSLSKTREIMLENSFSYLPIILDEEYYFISDFVIAKLWHENKFNDKVRYNKRIDSMLSKENLLPAGKLLDEDEIKKALDKMKDKPMLVFNGTHKNRSLVGILAPFDLL